MTHVFTISAWIATLLFALITVWTRYPFLVDDYAYLFKSYSPDFSILDFSYLFTERPFAELQSYLCFKYHVFEKTKILFWVYYFFHSLGVLGIFRWLVIHLGSRPLKSVYFSKENRISARKWALILIASTVALYPNWYEMTLMALDLPFSFGLPMLALALYFSNPWSRFIFLLLSFTSLETYIFPAILLLLLPELVQFPKVQKKKFIFNCLRASLPWLAATVSFFLLQKVLLNLTHAIAYTIDLKLINLSSLGTTIKLLWTLHFYKVNWISTLMEWGALIWVITALIIDRDDGKVKKVRMAQSRAGSISGLLCASAYSKIFSGEFGGLCKSVLFLLILPILGCAHCLLYHTYAPRAIHGGMVLKAALTGLLFAEFIILKKQSARQFVPIAMIVLAYLSHHALVVKWRGENGRVIEEKIAAITEEMKTCTSPCLIHVDTLSEVPHWDWILVPTYREPIVKWIARRDQIDKEFRLSTNPTVTIEK